MILIKVFLPGKLASVETHIDAGPGVAVSSDSGVRDCFSNGTSPLKESGCVSDMNITCDSVAKCSGSPITDRKHRLTSIIENLTRTRKEKGLRMYNDKAMALLRVGCVRTTLDTATHV
ncbi:hypothetical protein CBL_03557 [Carabus blaptoides fortunei]